MNFAFDRKSYAAQVSGSDAAENTLRSTLVPPTYVQVNGEDFGKVVEKQLVTYGDQWKGVSLADGQTSLYNPEKPKLHLRKPKLNCKNKAFNSQFIWTTLSAKWTTAWSNKLAPSNNL